MVGEEASLREETLTGFQLSGVLIAGSSLWFDRHIVYGDYAFNWLPRIYSQLPAPRFWELCSSDARRS